MKIDNLKNEVVLREEYEKYLKSYDYKMIANVKFTSNYHFEINVEEDNLLSFEDWKNKFHENSRIKK